MPPVVQLPSNARPTIVLDLDAWHRLLAKAKLRSDAAVAVRLGTSRQAVWRIQTGQREPGAAFIAAVLDRIPGAKFDRLFRVTAGAGE